MKHKFLTAATAIVAALCLCLSFAGCAHTHTYATAWSSDESGHWHAATCAHTSERKDEGAHTYENGKCTTCNYEHKEHTFGAYSKTETGHAHLFRLQKDAERGPYLQKRNLHGLRI